jgi:hypothetical protein
MKLIVAFRNFATRLKSGSRREVNLLLGFSGRRDEPWDSRRLYHVVSDPRNSLISLILNIGFLRVQTSVCFA